MDPGERRQKLIAFVVNLLLSHSDSSFKHGDKKWIFTGFYGNPESGNRHLSWTLLRRLRCLHDLHDVTWLVGGDFNEICFDSENIGGNPRPLSQTRVFREVLNACSLQDLHAEGEFFTWVNRRSSDNIIFERLDRFVATFEWIMLYLASRVYNLEFYHSDHRPILIELGGPRLNLPRNRTISRFEQHWATEHDCRDVIEQGWGKDVYSSSLPNRLRRCMDTLRTWAGDRFGKLPKQIQNKHKQLNQLRTQVQWLKSTYRIGVLEREIEVLASKEELYWKQRSRVNWLWHGDRNSKYFHACALARRARNLTRGLVSTHGDWCLDQSSMAEIVEHYFATLFQSSNPTADDRNQILDCVAATIDEHFNSVLCAPFTADEVRNAVFEMHPDKAPASDGMSVFFFQKFWDVIGDEVSVAILQILNDGEALDDWNTTIVTLLPKLQSHMTMKDFRPISLCNVCYKIVSRSLMNWLRPILKVTVNEFQSAFIPGRLISDNIILSFEALHWIRNRKQGHKGYGALKLDMSKAYDRMEWDFLEGIMLRLGFSPIWVENIMRCVRTVRHSFSLNGKIVGNVFPRRGLRQRDPLSPYLFVLCAQGLSSALLSLEERRLLSGVRIASACPSITHIFFADDSLQFFIATLRDCEAIRNCLISYERASGQLINFEKSSLSFSPNTDPQLAENINSMLAIPVVQGHEVYLGLPVFSTRSKKLQVRYLVERVVKRIQGWGNKAFSVGGKETLIKYVLQSITTYAISCFSIPNAICGEIERECSNFWWGVDEGKKRMHWKTWKALCKPKCMGGLGFRLLENFNKDLLAKQIWRIIMEPKSLVARVLKARYFRHQDVMEAGLGNNPSYFWRSLLWSRPILDFGLCWRVGDGAKINVYKDKWIPNLRSRVSLVQEYGNGLQVKDHIDNGSWNAPLIQQLFPQHLVNDILAIPIPTAPTNDFRFWTNDPKGKYSVKDGYKTSMGFYESPESSSSFQLQSWWKFLWALSIPPKVRIFCWRVVHNIIPTEQNLLAHHVLVLGMCPLCHSTGDSTSHALFFCPVVKPCWKGTWFWMILKQVCHLEALDVLIWMKEHLCRTEFEVFVMRTWAIWSDRLRLIHRNEGRLGRVNADWSETLLQNYQHARSAITIVADISQCRSDAIWVAPPTDKLKLDVDAACNERTNNYAIGGVVRNSEGQPVLAFGWKIDKPQSITCSELTAIACGLDITKLHNLQIHQVATDSLLAVQAVTGLEENLSYVGSLATDIRRLMDSHINIHISHVIRSANEVAHSIAAFVISSPSQFVWEVGEFPLWLIRLITKDIFDSQ